MLSFVLFFALFNTAYAGTAGVFQMPFSPPSSYKPTPEQYTMQWNTDFQKYHLAEDWNGIGGGSTDMGYPLYAIADGVVIAVDNIGTVVPSIGKAIKVRYTLPDGKQVDSVYMHVQDIFVIENAIVVPGQKIATIGDGNGYYLNNAHLHWEMRTDLSLELRKNPYYNPLSVVNARKYIAPSLFVDDRIGGISIPITNGNWVLFIVQNYTPSSTAYIQNQSNERFSIKRAVDTGLIASYGVIWQGTNGVWYYNPDVTQIFFEPGVNYAVFAKGNSLSLNLLFPGNNYKGDRARIDMVRAATADARFTNVRTETYAENLSWDPAWELRYMGFGFSTTGNLVSINQATNKANPFIRYTTYYDPATNQWTPWVEVGKNTLY